MTLTEYDCQQYDITCLSWSHYKIRVFFILMHSSDSSSKLHLFELQLPVADATTADLVPRLISSPAVDPATRLSLFLDPSPAMQAVVLCLLASLYAFTACAHSVELTLTAPWSSPPFTVEFM